MEMSGVGRTGGLHSQNGGTGTSAEKWRRQYSVSYRVLYYNGHIVVKFFHVCLTYQAPPRFIVG